MNDYIKANYPLQGKQPTYDQLREMVRAAWDSISVEFLRGLIDGMHDRCQAVIDARGGPTKY